MTKRHRKKWVDALSLVLPVLLFFAVLNCFTTYLYYQDYQCKMDILTNVTFAAESLPSSMRSKIPTQNGSSKNIVSFPFTLSMGIEKGDCFSTIALNLMAEYEVTSKKFCCLKVKNR